MSTLLMRLVGPMQAWGVQSRFSVRDTGRQPSKSAVIGLLCAALGRTRRAALDDLAALRMGVRVDQEGVLAVDFHTALQVYRAAGGAPKPTEISRRYYLCDAAFLVGLEGERSMLETLQGALAIPRWCLYLGRRSFVPSEPVWLPDGLRLDEPLEDALRNYPWLGRLPAFYEELAEVRAVIDDPAANQVSPETPLSFEERAFAPRRTGTYFIPKPALRKEPEPCTSQD